MRFFDDLQNKIGFTRTEALAVLILSGTFLAGIGIRWIQSSQNHPLPAAQRFDYSRTDSIYAARGRTQAAGKLPSPSSTQVDKTSRRTTKIVNINSATKTQLMNLPGIGPAIAERIIAFRTAHGGFRSIDEFSNVKGIGKKKFEKIRPFISTK